MLTQLQTTMLANAHAQDPALIVQIFNAALAHNDGDTQQYILQHYLHKLSIPQQVNILFAIVLQDEGDTAANIANAAIMQAMQH